MKKQTTNISENARRRVETKQRDRLTRLYPSAVVEARGFGKDPIKVPEKTLRELEESRVDSYRRAFHGKR